MARARDIACQVLLRVLDQGAYASLALAGELAAAGLDARDRRLVTELVYGTLRHLSRIDRALGAKTTRGLGKVKPATLAILRVAGYQVLFLDRVPDHAAVSEAVSAARRRWGPRVGGFVNRVLRRLAREGEPALPPESDARRHAEVACSLPGWIVVELAGHFSDPADLLAAARGLTRPADLAIRVNRTRIDRDALIARLREENPDIEITRSELAPEALLIRGLGAPEQSASFVAGLWTVQDVAAQLVGHLLAPPAPGPGRPLRILDACAGVGGKTTHLAELLDPTRHAAAIDAVAIDAVAIDAVAIDAVDRSARKLELCAATAARLGLSSIACHVADVTRPDDAPGLAADYDAVLLDAPCTGLGVLRRHPETKWRLAGAWTSGEEGARSTTAERNGNPDVARMAALQRDLLDAAAARVRPGGVLVYSVCTFTRAEGRDQVADFLARWPEFSLAAPPRSGPWAAASPEPGILTTWPHCHDADGFFAARMVRRAAAGPAEKAASSQPS